MYCASQISLIKSKATPRGGVSGSIILSYPFRFHFLYLQSSALGFLLAQKHFTNPLVAVPSAVSVVCMAVRQDIFLLLDCFVLFISSKRIQELINDYFSLLSCSLGGVLQLCIGGIHQFPLMTKMTSRNENHDLSSVHCLSCELLLLRCLGETYFCIS